MRFLSWLALTALCGATLSSPAQAFSLSLVGAGGWSKPETVPEGNFQAKAAFGYGALAEFSLVPTLGLELGALKLPRSYHVATAFVEIQDQLMVPVVLRAHFLNIFSLGVGGYYSSYSGNLQYQQQSGGYSYPGDYGTAGLTRSDYGVVTSAALYYPIAPGARLLLDGRYLIGMKDNDTTYYERKFRDIQVLFGLQLGF